MLEKDKKPRTQATGTELSNNKNDSILLNNIYFADIPDSFDGETGLKTEPIYRQYKCRICHESFKRSQGTLLISGFYCNNHNPKRF